jgi:predicted N-acetyltransferase YhbS
VSVTIRPAELRDEGRVFALLEQLFGAGDYASGGALNVFRDLVAGKGGTALVAADTDATVLGVITVSYIPAVRYSGRYAQVEELVVDEAARGRDAGASLVRAAIDAAREAGCAEIGLYAREHNRPFYEKLGLIYSGPELRLALK